MSLAGAPAYKQPTGLVSLRTYPAPSPNALLVPRLCVGTPGLAPRRMLPCPYGDLPDARRGHPSSETSGGACHPGGPVKGHSSRAGEVARMGSGTATGYRAIPLHSSDEQNQSSDEGSSQGSTNR